VTQSAAVTLWPQKDSPMDYQVLSEAGSDASYDLIVEAVSPRPPGGFVVEALDAQQRALGEQVAAEVGLDAPPVAATPGTGGLEAGADIGYRIRLFQRTPELWVWIARIEALRDKLRASRGTP
jgi:hypothetical protein